MTGVSAQAARAEKTIPERLLPWIALTGALTGALFSGIQFLEAKEKARIDRVFSYVSEFKAEGMRKNYIVAQEMGVRLTENFREYRSGLAADPVLSADERRKRKIHFYFEQYATAYRQDAEFKAATDRLFLFYEEIAICAQEKLCDEKTVRSFFQLEASAFLDNARPLVCRQRLTWNDVDGTETLPVQQQFFRQHLLDCSEQLGLGITTAVPS